MDLTNAPWRKSSYSGGNGGNCIEAAWSTGLVAVRDSKDPAGPKLVVTPVVWRKFTDQIKAG